MVGKLQIHHQKNVAFYVIRNYYLTKLIIVNLKKESNLMDALINAKNRRGSTALKMKVVSLIFAHIKSC